MLLIAITIVGGVIVAAMSYHIYRSETARVFNRAIKLRDDKHFDEAREGFNHVLKQLPQSSLAVESAYYIAST